MLTFWLLCNCAFQYHSGYDGPRCEVDINECEGVTCGRGRCIDQVGSYRCECNPGFIGQRCDQEVDECSSGPCMNGATCKKLINTYVCLCLPGTDG